MIDENIYALMKYIQINGTIVLDNESEVADLLEEMNNGINFNRQKINTCLYKYCNKAEIIKKSSHKVRRNVISTLLDNIANKESVRLFAGHEDLQTTLNSYYKDITDDKALYEGMCNCLQSHTYITQSSSKQKK